MKQETELGTQNLEGPLAGFLSDRGVRPARQPAEAGRSKPGEATAGFRARRGRACRGRPAGSRPVPRAFAFALEPPRGPGCDPWLGRCLPRGIVEVIDELTGALARYAERRGRPTELIVDDAGMLTVMTAKEDGGPGEAPEFEAAAAFAGIEMLWDYLDSGSL